MVARVFLLLALVIAPVAAQDEPARDADGFDALIGNWVGEGSVQMVPGEPKVRWKCKNTFARILGGHFIREDVRIEFPGGEVPTLCYRTFYGWNAEERRYHAYTIGNDGQTVIPDRVTLRDGHLMMSSVSENERGTVVHRTTAHFRGDRCEFRNDVASGSDGFRTLVEGILERGGSGCRLGDDDLAKGIGPAPDPMRVLQSLCGDYTMEGHMAAVTGSPKMKLSGREIVSSLFDGAIIGMEVTGRADLLDEEYAAFAYIGWDADAEEYRQFWLNSFGNCGSQTLYRVEERTIVIPRGGTESGRPVASRTILELDENGAMKRVVMESMNGTADPQQTFVGEYEKRKPKVRQKFL